MSSENYTHTIMGIYDEDGNKVWSSWARGEPHFPIPNVGEFLVFEEKDKDWVTYEVTDRKIGHREVNDIDRKWDRLICVKVERKDFPQFEEPGE